MSFIDRLFRHDPLPHVIVKHVAATASENRAAARKRRDTELGLAVYVAKTTPEQRRIDTELHAAVARAIDPRA